MNDRLPTKAFDDEWTDTRHLRRGKIEWLRGETAEQYLDRILDETMKPDLGGC